MDEKALLEAIRAIVKEELEPVKTDMEAVKTDMEAVKTSIEAGFKQNREAIAEVVEVVGQKVDRLESVIREVKGATAQNAYELQVLKSKAQ